MVDESSLERSREERQPCFLVGCIRLIKRNDGECGGVGLGARNEMRVLDLEDWKGK